MTVEGVKTLRKVFGSISKATPALALSTLFLIVSISSFPGQTQQIAGYLSLIVKIIGFACAMLAYGSFVWMYASSIRGLHHLGKHHLCFVFFYEDSHRGMKSLGSLSLSSAWTYFLGT